MYKKSCCGYINVRGNSKCDSLDTSKIRICTLYELPPGFFLHSTVSLNFSYRDFPTELYAVMPS